MDETRFPLEFPFNRIYAEDLKGKADAPFVVIAMLTAGYADRARRLVDSCQQFGLPHVLYEVPTVHASISPGGSADLRFTKANFIHFALERLDRPVLYLDADVYVASEPDAISQVARDGYDFAVYNWLADRDTAAYRSIDVKFGDAAPVTDQFYAFSHSIDRFAEDQLICSGAVQYYGNTGPARRLLRRWHEAVSRFEGSADDACLDFAFNNYPSGEPKPRAYWLDKSYSRYGFWIHVRPVLDHPAIALRDSAFREIKDPAGHERWYPERTRIPAVTDPFPRDCLIDVKRRLLCRMENGKLVPFARFERQLWI